MSTIISAPAPSVTLTKTNPGGARSSPITEYSALLRAVRGAGLQADAAKATGAYSIVIAYLNRVRLSAGGDPFDCPAASAHGR